MVMVALGAAKERVSASGREAFTLLEMSVVLVIIGLLAGGIVVGKSLIQTAKIRATVRQYEEYKTAASLFHTQYNCIPGDCAHATKAGFKQVGGWGQVNGNGNGQVNFNIVGYGSGNENVYFWYHLAEANLIPSYPPTLPVDHYAYTGSYYAPGGWYIYYLPELHVYGDNGGYPLFSTGMEGHGFEMMSCFYGCNSDGIVTPYSAYQIDSKVDDGLPGSGIVRTGGAEMDGIIGRTTDVNLSASQRCISGSYATPLSTTYNLSNTGYNCSLVLDAGF
jgi:prepilin-type N-terminal cleavage/methylation domain-containing protein